MKEIVRLKGPMRSLRWSAKPDGSIELTIETDESSRAEVDFWRYPLGLPITAFPFNASRYTLIIEDEEPA